MPSDLITADYQAQLGTFLIGSATCTIGPGGISGLGSDAPKTHDADLDHAAGAYPGPDFAPVRVLIFDCVLLSAAGVSNPAADVMGTYTDLLVAWAPVTVDADLYLQLPGWGAFKVTGRPRGVADDLSSMPLGVIPAQLTFVCNDPTITYL